MNDIRSALERIAGVLDGLEKRSVTPCGETQRRILRTMVRFNYAESALWQRPDTVPADLI